MVNDFDYQQGARIRKQERRRNRKERREYSNKDWRNAYGGDQNPVEDEFEEYEGQGKRRKTKEKVMMPQWKLFVVGAAIFLCFALLYPSVFAPMINNLFGGKRSDEANRNVHPSMLGAGPQNPREARQGRPYHPHPGAAGAVHQQQQGMGGQTSTGKTGNFAWLLPFYTVGVVGFLLYTLFKMVFKRKKGRRGAGRDRLLDWEEDGDAEEEEDESEAEDNVALGYGTRGQKLSSVQSRLRKTELAMQEILHQLETIAEQSSQQSNGRKGGDNKEIPEEQSKEAESNIGQTAEGNGGKEDTLQPDGDRGGLSAEQKAQVEESLRELKVLSGMCKRDQRIRRRLRDDWSSDEEEGEEEEEQMDDRQEGDHSQSEEEEEASGRGAGGRGQQQKGD